MLLESAGRALAAGGRRQPWASRRARRQHSRQRLGSAQEPTLSGCCGAIAGLYRDLGILRYGNLIEIPAANLPRPTPRDTAAQVNEVVKVTGDLVMITGAHAWHDLPTTASTCSAACTGC